MTEDRKIKTLEEQYQGVSIRDLQTELTRLPYKEQTSRQMAALHSGNTGVICLPRKSHTEDKTLWLNDFFYDLSSQEEPSIFPMTDSYVSMNPLDGEKDKLGRVLRTNAHCLGINGLYLDIDVLHGMDPYDSEKADKAIGIVLSVLFLKLPKPTMVLLSGRGLTFVYRYDHLLQGEEITLHDAVYRALIEKVQKLFDPSIVEVDAHVTDHARVCRLAGTKNVKAGRTALLHTCTGTRYEPGKLYSLFGLSEVIVEKRQLEKKKSSRKKKKNIQKAEPIRPDQVPFVTNDRYLVTVKRRLSEMEQVPDMVSLVDGSGRHNLCFLYYCHARFLHNQQETEQLVRKLNARFQEPLDDTELESMITSVASHIEKLGYHGNGTYMFSCEKYLDYLPLSIEESRKAGFTKSLDLKIQCAEHQKEALERDQTIARLWLEAGLNYTDISRELVKMGFRGPSRDSVRRAVKRMGIINRDISYEEIDWDRVKRYTHGNKKAKKIASPNGPRTFFEPKKGRGEEAEREQEEAFEKLKSGEDCCILGAAGTGKSTLIKKFIDFSEEAGKHVTILASTGSAAEHIGGETIHHCFKIPVQENYDTVFPHERYALEQTDILVMDEIGMVDANLFQHCVCVVEEAKFFFNRHIQIVLCGDFRQLAPVHVSGYAFYLRKYRIWDNLIILTHVWRQEQKAFSDALEHIANGNPAGMSYFHTHAAIQMDFTKIREDLEQGAVYLGAYRKDVDTVNTRMIWYHRKDDSFKEWKASDGSLLPTYIGMPVIFVKNTDQFANGTRGTIVEVGENSVSVQIDSKIIQVYKERIRDGEKTISQLPIRPAYAMTIHKGQGLTMSKVILNPKCFAPGQLYTALSRVRRIEDLVLTQKIRPQDVIASPEVIDFMKQVG